MKTSQLFSFSFIALALTLAAVTAQTVLADTTQADAAQLVSKRMEKRLGIYAGLADPAPGLFGITVAYNLFDFMRLTAGYGQVSMTTGISLSSAGDVSTSEATVRTLGAGAKFLVPGWSLSPVLGLNFANVSYSGSGLALDGFESSGSHVYTNFGIDWQAKSGLSLGAGYETSFRSGVGGGMYLNAGWFFNISG